MSDWSDERTERLTKLWAQGLSCTRIAVQLGGCTRNAVIGKVHRLGLSGRATPSKPLAKAARPGPRRANNFAAVNLPRKPRLIVCGDGAVLEKPEGHAPRAGFDAQAFAAPPDGEPIPLLALAHGMCRWPLGDPLEPGFGFCGHATDEGAYCAHHREIAYKPPTPGAAKSANELARSLRRWIAA